MAELALLVGEIGSAVAEGTAAVAGAAEGAGSALSLIGTGLTVAGTVGSGIAAKQQGKAAAESLKRQGTEEQAIASREAEDRRRDVGLVLSKQKNVAAASGAGVLNPTILDIMGDTAQRGDYYARSATSAGENRAAGLMDQAAAARFKGDSAFSGSILEGIGKGVGGVNDYFNPRPKKSGYA